MAYSYSDLTTDIRNYTEVDSNVFTAAIINGFLRNAEHRINLDCPMDSDRFQDQGQFVTDFNSARSNLCFTGNNNWELDLQGKQ